MKTPEEIKKGLECCADYGNCTTQGCPYNPIKDCGHDLYSDALAYIQHLEAERDQYKRERDAAVMDMYHAASDGGSFCDICKYKGEPCDIRKFEEIECWQWRGVQEALK